MKAMNLIFLPVLAISSVAAAGSEFDLSGTMNNAYYRNETGRYENGISGTELHNASGSSYVYNQAINAARGEAALVAADMLPNPSPLFFSAAEAASGLLKVKFKSNREAAIAILSQGN
jgi:hypothetical protein